VVDRYGGGDYVDDQSSDATIVAFHHHVLDDHYVDDHYLVWLNVADLN